MFAIVYGMFNLIGAIISGTKAAKRNYECIKEAELKRAQGKNRAGIYYDRKGATRLLDTHELVSIDNL